jgi:hypothetical protein
VLLPKLAGDCVARAMLADRLLFKAAEAVLLPKLAGDCVARTMLADRLLSKVEEAECCCLNWLGIAWPGPCWRIASCPK